MHTWRAKMSVAMLIAASVTVVCAIPATAQESTQAAAVQLHTPYVGVAVEPGDTTTFPLDVAAPIGSEVQLDVTDVPDGWDALIRGGGFVVDRVVIGENSDLNLQLEVTVPADTPEGDYRLGVTATTATSSDHLDLDLVAAEAIGGGVSLNAEFPVLQGPADVDFSYSLELANDTGDEVQFGLQAQGPDGWQVTATPSGQNRASTVTVASGSTERVTVDVDPPDTTPAGTYPVTVQAAGGGQTATAELTVVITGNFDMALVTPDERLNVDVEAGSQTDLPMVIVNQGSAALTDVSLSATPPRGWEVEFTPASIGRIEPGGSAEVTAHITPSSDAIAGDYRITMRANVAETSDSIEVRATVETSALWGVVGIGVIMIALVALVLVFRRFGRR